MADLPLECGTTLTISSRPSAAPPSPPSRSPSRCLSCARRQRPARSSCWRRPRALTASTWCVAAGAGCVRRGTGAIAPIRSPSISWRPTPPMPRLPSMTGCRWARAVSTGPIWPRPEMQILDCGAPVRRPWPVCRPWRRDDRIRASSLRAAHRRHRRPRSLRRRVPRVADGALRHMVGLRRRQDRDVRGDDADRLPGGAVLGGRAQSWADADIGGALTAPDDVRALRGDAYYLTVRATDCAGHRTVGASLPAKLAGAAPDGGRVELTTFGGVMLRHVELVGALRAVAWLLEVCWRRHALCRVA